MFGRVKGFLDKVTCTHQNIELKAKSTNRLDNRNLQIDLVIVCSECGHAWESHALVPLDEALTPSETKGLVLAVTLGAHFIEGFNSWVDEMFPADDQDFQQIRDVAHDITVWYTKSLLGQVPARLIKSKRLSTLALMARGMMQQFTEEEDGQAEGRGEDPGQD